jgi:hypothetical protein
MEENSIREIGGNKFNFWLGNKLTKIGKNLITNGKKTVISNPTCKLINPFTLVLNFVVDTNDKYQLVLQGDYKVKYKEVGSAENSITPNEMFLLITSNEKGWFLKS